MLKINSPDAEVVSMAPPLSDRNPTPLSFSSVTTETKCRIERPSRSKRHTTRVSPAHKVLKHSSSPGRSDAVPVTLSRKMVEQPAALSSLICRDRSCSFVLTRPVPISLPIT